jgi:hypothetical protein
VPVPASLVFDPAAAGADQYQLPIAALAPYRFNITAASKRQAVDKAAMKTTVVLAANHR